MSNLGKNVILLTGCGSGIGKALARAFHRAGHRVCATARRESTIADLASEGILALPLDVTDHEAVARTLAHLRGMGLEVDTLVNNAGYGAMGPMADVPDSEWRRQFDINLFAPIHLVRTVLPGMIGRRRGTVVNISSVSGVMVTPFAGPYCASKAAFNAASEALRMEVKPFGIRVVTVQPGGIRSSFGKQAATQVSLAEDSPYQPIREGVLARANDSQSDAMPADEFAARLVAQLAKPRCPAVVRLGPKSWLMPFMGRWMPMGLRDWILGKRFRLNRLCPPPTGCARPPRGHRWWTGGAGSTAVAGVGGGMRRGALNWKDG